MKNIYEAPELDVFVYETEDIITDSGSKYGDNDFEVWNNV